jgi:hypothetical protein
MHDGTEDPAGIAATPASTMDIDEARSRTTSREARSVDVQSQSDPVVDLGDPLDSFRHSIRPAGEFLPPRRRRPFGSEFACRHCGAPDQHELQDLCDCEHPDAKPSDGEIHGPARDQPCTDQDPEEKPKPGDLGNQHAREPQGGEARGRRRGSPQSVQGQEQRHEGVDEQKGRAHVGPLDGKDRDELYQYGMSSRQ